MSVLTGARTAAHGPGAELLPVHELQVDMLGQSGEQSWSVAREPRLHHELVLVDQSLFRQRQRERHTSHQQSPARLLLQVPNGLLKVVAGYEFRVPIDPVQRARHDVLLGPIDRVGEGDHPLGHPLRLDASLRERPPPVLHQCVGHPTEEQGIGLRERFGCVTMHFFVRDHHAMIATSVQGDVDGIPKWPHVSRVSRARRGSRIVDQRATYRDHFRGSRYATFGGYSIRSLRRHTAPPATPVACNRGPPVAELRDSNPGGIT